MLLRVRSLRHFTKESCQLFLKQERSPSLHRLKPNITDVPVPSLPFHEAQQPNPSLPGFFSLLLKLFGPSDVPSCLSNDAFRALQFCSQVLDFIHLPEDRSKINRKVKGKDIIADLLDSSCICVWIYKDYKGKSDKQPMRLHLPFNSITGIIQNYTVLYRSCHQI